MPTRDRKPATVQNALAPSPPRFSGGEGWGEVVLIKTSTPPAPPLSRHMVNSPLVAALPRGVLCDKPLPGLFFRVVRLFRG